MNSPYKAQALCASEQIKNLCERIDFTCSEEKPLSANLFDSLAKSIADELDCRDDKCNKTTQIRRFYDELVGWNERVGNEQKKFEELEAFIKMMNAKVAYSFGRNRDEKKGRLGLVDDNFKHWFTACLGKTNSATALKHFRLHFEAVLGFLKALRG